MMLLLLILFAYCSKAISVVPVDELTQGMLKFSADIYQQCAQSEAGNGNMIISPFSISMALTFLSQGANGTTYNELRNGLYLNSNKSIVANQFHELDQLVRKSAGDSELFIANRIYVMEKYQLKKGFKDVAVDKFSSGIESVNFVQQDKTATIINRFVEQKTQERIKDFISPKMLDKDTRFFLINAIYLKCKWRNSFRNETIGPIDDQWRIRFYINETDFIWVDSLQKKRAKFNVGFDLEDLDAHALEIAYFNSNFTFLVILPTNRTGLLALEDRLKDYNVSKVFDQMNIKEINVKLPKFKVETEIHLQESLTNLGMATMFDPDRADFSGIVNTTKRIYVDYVIHKAIIEINEEHTVAAAATGARGKIKSLLQRANFNAEHPFVYYVWDKQNKIPILSGHIKSFK